MSVGNTPLSSPLTPTRIEVIGDELAVAWNDGGESYLKLEPLRRHCPCASCGGEPDLLGHVRPLVTYREGSFALREWRVIGGYSLQLVWNDGHNTGLYTYAFLRKLNDALAN
ncbi:DUF971 family protein [Verrucomicrobium sp. GAS474]|uniref:DUF971 domain-containing protein n=1 Tax=Verrucomicrobium sp. GAS474 TaxID=1882831 RepID=UPI000879FB0E|nr:DUF971 domain-containing protein [Verrucomicrobium sp. GAS474]SDU16542.1 DUF971 family protein [Verrucomicrobium sp. GAS474]